MYVIYKKDEKFEDLNIPKSAWKVPVKKVTVKTVRRYAVGSAAGSTTLETIAESSNETTATGPIAISLELPITAYINGGTTLVSEILHNYSINL